MGIGKYSPTVSMWYAQDQNWYEKNGGSCAVVDADGQTVDYHTYDKDGYDRYGYHRDTELDRAGYSESEYINDSIDYYDANDCEGSWVYEDVSREYSGVPAPTCAGVEHVNGEWIIRKT